MRLEEKEREIAGLCKCNRFRKKGPLHTEEEANFNITIGYCHMKEEEKKVCKKYPCLKMSKREAPLAHSMKEIK